MPPDISNHLTVEIDPRVISAAIADAMASGDRASEEEAIRALMERLVEDRGEDAVAEALAGERNDPFIAAALLEICLFSEKLITDYFSDEEIVQAALAYLLSVEDGTASLATGRWAWSALFQQYDSSPLNVFDGDDHFRILLRLIDQAPMVDSVLFMIGDGPLAHAAAVPGRFELIMRLAKDEPKIARAWWLNETDGGPLQPE
jgi:hypothetical protein